MKILAIVIGNNNYPDPDKLTGAIADAQAMHDVFVRLGYHTIPFYDCRQADIPLVLETLEKELPNFDASIFYYAGHGFQVDGENFLPSIDCQISYANKYQLRQESIVLSELLDIYRPYDKKTNIIILDACRVRPALRGCADSFAPIQAPQGTLIAFSTSPNSTAKESRAGGHGLYTEALLTYIGRERLAVEELFKKVRRTVVQWSSNTQIPWEHTSLIGDFYFNTGQMVVSLQIPYHESVVKDAMYNEPGEFGRQIAEIKSCDFYRQNPAIDVLCAKRAVELDKNQQFILGRNLLQSSSASFSAQRFMNSIAVNLRKYHTADGDNHVLNGMLFEIYFDSHGEFRGENLKRHFFDEIMALRNHPEFAKSFNFIRTVLAPYRDALVFFMPDDNSKVDIDITASSQKTTNTIGEEETWSIISSISVNGADITEAVRRKYVWYGVNFIDVLAEITKAPLNAIDIHSNVPLEHRITFEKEEGDTPF